MRFEAPDDSGQGLQEAREGKSPRHGRVVRGRSPALVASESGSAQRRQPSREGDRAVKFTSVVPIMRIFDEEKAKQFYIDHLGMTVDWEHRFAPGLPLYLQVSREGLLLHLSEHHGDGTPGTAVYVAMTGVAGLHAEIRAKGHADAGPGLETDEFGTHVWLIDPFGNTLRFNEPPPA